MTLQTAPEALLDALAEDRRATWVPDVLGWGDAAALVAVPDDQPIGAIETMYYPKPDGSMMRIALLGVAGLAWFHRATDPVRDRAAEILAPGVCGYRQGAEAGFAYSGENLRFHEFSAAEAEHSEYVAVADVSRFFEHVPWELALRSAADVVRHDDELTALRCFAHAAAGAGLVTLPAGYADARLLANLVLRRADAAVEDRFTRWVDDYRVFAATEREAHESLHSLRAALAIDGLMLNESKTRVVTSADFIASSGNSLQSVYHPDVESPGQVRAALRSVFLVAANEPTAQRRALRFVLPRMASEGDDFAVDWALQVLTTIPWEAPRICGYLAKFADRPLVASAVEDVLLRAVTSNRDAWFAARIAALACHTGISVAGSRALATSLRQTRSDAVWGLCLRSLALSGHGAEVRHLIASGVRDARAASGALADLGERSAIDRISNLPLGTRELLTSGTAPLPDLDAIL